MVLTETGRNVFDGICEDGRIAVDVSLLEDGRRIVEHYSSLIVTLLQTKGGVFKGPWPSGYIFQKKCTVIATTAGAQTNYQLELIVGESDGAVGAGVHCNGHCQNFPNDIRFTKEDGITKHDYWVESITGTTPNRLVTVIIEVASIPASGAVSFYLYYGAPGASSESSIADTFIREIDGAQPLIGAWNLDNISSDKSGNGNDGTLNGGMGYGTGKIGQAAVFDGIDDHINCGSNNCLNLTTGVTVEAWIKPGDNLSVAPIISKGCLFSAYALNIRNDLLQFQAYRMRYTPYAFTTGVWYHVAGTFGDGYTKIYINGNLEYSKAETGPIGTVAEALFIGWDGDSAAPTPHYKGTVDEGKLYNRALTGDEISDIYGAGGDRYGYATTDYPGRVLVRKYASPEPTWGSWGAEEEGQGLFLMLKLLQAKNISMKLSHEKLLNMKLSQK